jgi:hypothetical protein
VPGAVRGCVNLYGDGGHDGKCLRVHEWIFSFWLFLSP